ncbi:MAG: AI-2E family transporter [Oscillospiraceae bacterium]|nr:AI-2E family transporter [Oscillospiraceae bacterium]MBQ9938907.1 AI-2E family transporter [Oscillospiraceae bacterium]
MQKDKTATLDGREDVLAKRRRFLINFGYFSAVALIIWLCAAHLAELLLPFWAGLFIALALKPAVDALSSLLKLKRKPMAFALTSLMYLSAAGILSLLLLFTATSVGRLLAGLPEIYSDSILPAIEGLEQLIIRFGGERLLAYFASGGLSALGEQLAAEVLEHGAALASSLPSALLTATFTIVFSLFICADYNNVTGFIARQLPKKHRQLLFDAKSALLQGIGKMLGAYLLLMFITFALLLLAFWLLGVKSPFAVAAVTAVLDALPLFGVGVLLVPWAVTEFLRGNFAMGAALLLTFAVITLLRNLLEPRLLGKNTSLDPVAALLSIYLGWRLFGFAGLFLMPLVFLVLCRLCETGKLKLWVRKS